MSLLDDVREAYALMHALGPTLVKFKANPTTIERLRERVPCQPEFGPKRDWFAVPIVPDEEVPLEIYRAIYSDGTHRDVGR